MRRSKQRRTYLKRFSAGVVNTGGAERLDKHHMRELYGASSMIGTPPDTKHNTFAQAIPPTTMEMPWRSDKFQGVDKYQYINMYNLGNKRLDLFFHGEKWFFRKERTGPTGEKLVEISIIYESKINATLALEYNRIRWIKTQG